MGAVIAAALAVFLLSAATLFWAWRGRRVDDHPLCRACKFDLSGKPETSTQCSECGADLSANRAIRIGNRRRRWNWVVFSGGVLTFGLLSMAAALLVAVGGTEQYPRLPTRVLGWIAIDANHQRRVAAVKELRARLAQGLIAANELDGVVDRVLALQADVSQPWDIVWGDLVESLEEHDLLDHERLRKYVSNILDPEVNLRATHVPGDIWRVFITGSCRNGTVLFLDSQFSAKIIGAGGTDLGETGIVGTMMRPEHLFSVTLEPQYMSSLDVKWLKDPLTLPQRPIEVRVKFTRDFGSWKPSFPRKSIVSSTKEKTFSIRVLAADRDPAAQSGEAGVAAEVRALMGPPQVVAEYDSAIKAEYETYTIKLAKRAPIDLAFEIQLRDGERLLRREPMILRKGDPGPLTGDLSPYILSSGGSKALPNEVTVLLKPSASVARSTQDMAEFAGVEFRFDHVPVTRSDETRAATRAAATQRVHGIRPRTQPATQAATRTTHPTTSNLPSPALPNGQ